MTRPFKPSSQILIKGKAYPYLNDDSPMIAYQRSGPAFVAQPLPHNSEQYGIIPVPLMMTDEWDMICDEPTLIPKLRGISSREQEYKFNFIGQTTYMGREVFSQLSGNLDGYLFQETSPIFNLKPEVKREHLKEFLKAIARSEFTFAPRGIGSSSFRAYQSMMVGSIPIITGMNDYPFKNEVDWDTICIRGDLNNIQSLIAKANDMTEEEKLEMRQCAMDFWDNYCKHDKLYEKLESMV
jgi:hypothetical protein